MASPPRACARGGTPRCDIFGERERNYAWLNALNVTLLSALHNRARPDRRRSGLTELAYRVFHFTRLRCQIDVKATLRGKSVWLVTENLRYHTGIRTVTTSVNRSGTIPDMKFLRLAPLIALLSSNLCVFSLLGATAPSLVNLSSRSTVGTGADLMIAGFVVGGDAPKDVLIRAVGPGLADMGVSGVLSLPHVQVFDAQGESIQAHSRWNSALVPSFAQVGAFPLAAGSNDAALRVQLPPGSYTAQVSGLSGGAGVALVEIYEMDGTSRLLNVSTRARVGTDSGILISGLVIGPGSGTRRVLVRAAGPALQEFGVSSALADPALAVLDADGVTLLTNDNWSDTSAVDAIAEATRTVGAFAFHAGSKDAATLAELAPGSYTVQVRGVADTTGIALIEVYDLGGHPELAHVSLSATSPTTSSSSGSPGVFTLTRTGDLESSLAVTYSVSGSAAAGTDYQALPGQVAFGAGEAQATVSVVPIAEGSGNVILTLQPSAAYTLGTSSATISIVSIQAQPAPGQPSASAKKVSVAASIASISAVGGSPGAFTFTRTGPTNTSLTVNYTVGGTAASGRAYTPLSGSVTFATGAATASVALTPLANGGGTVVVALTSGSDYTVVTPSSATITIVPPPPATITVSATTPTTQAGSATPGVFTLQRTGPTTSALLVNYKVTGTATPSTDYAALSGSVNFPAAAAIATVTVQPTVTGSGTVDIALVNSGAYVLGSPSSASVTILPPPAVVTLTATTSTVRAGTEEAGVFTLTRTGSTSATLTVNYNVSGSATPGVDYTTLSGSAVFLAGASTATFNVAPTATGSGTVSVQLAPSSAYTLGGSIAGTVTILPALPEVNIVATTATTEADSGTPAVFTFSRSGTTTAPLAVAFTVSGTAGADAYAPLPTVVTFAPGAASITLAVQAVATGSGTVILTLSSAADYTLGAATQATATILPAAVTTTTYSASALTWDRTNIDARLGPTFTKLSPGAPDTRPLTFKQPTMALTAAQAKVYSIRVNPYELGTPGDDFGDYWSCSGQVAYVPDDPVNDPGLDRIQTFAYYNKVFALSPRLDPTNSKPHPDPQTRDPNQIEVNGGTMPMQPIAMVRNYGSWQNEALVLYRGGLLGVAGTQTSRAGSDRPYPAFKFPANKVPTAIAITTSNELALVTVWDTDRKQGQLAVIALEAKFLAYHTWPYMGLVNAGSWSDFKLLGYVDLPMTSPNAVAAAANSFWAPSTVAGKALSQIDLSNDHQRELVYNGDWQAIVAKGGYAIVSSTEDNKVAILDLTPLFQYIRESYFATAANYQNTIATRGPAPEQFPQAFSVKPELAPKIVWTADVTAPTCVLAGLKINRWSRDIYKAYVASRDGTVRIIDTSSLMNRSTWQTGGALRQIGSFQVGRNPVAMVFARYNISNLPLIPPTSSNGDVGASDPLNNLIHVACRGERSIDTVVTFQGQGTVFRRMQDARMDDPVGLGVADRGNIVTVADFHGRKIHSFRLNAINDKRNGVVYGCGPDGTDGYEYAGSLSVAGTPFLVNSANVN